MKLIFILLMSVLNQQTVLVEQGQVVVPLADLDAYVHNLPIQSRYGFVEDEGQVEKNILTLLNVNFVYQYLQDSNLIQKQEFASALDAIETVGITVDKQYSDKLGLDETQFLAVLKLYALKIEYFSRLNIYFQQEMLKGTVQSLAYDQFISEKEEYKQQERRHLSVIQLNKKNHNKTEAMALLKRLIEGEDFKDMALKLSDDPSVSLNKGDWKYFSENQFKYDFAEAVFSYDKLGTIPTVFEAEHDFYLISVEEIVPPKEADFDDHKQRIIDELLPALAKRKMQNIINEYSNKGDIQINAEAIREAYQRYLVFEEDSK